MSSKPRVAGDEVTNIALIGMMGSGKTVVGRALATALQWRFVDTDEEIVTSTQRTIPEIFAVEGEEAFRDLESAVVSSATATQHAVIATGGGAVLRETNRALLLSRCWVVWLTATPEEHARRVLQSERRPILERYADPVDGARKVLAVRAAFYAQAHHIVDTTGRSIDEVVTEILAALPG